MSSFLTRSLLFSMAQQLATEQERVYFEYAYTVFACILAETNILIAIGHSDRKLTDRIVIKREVTKYWLRKLGINSNGRFYVIQRSELKN